MGPLWPVGCRWARALQHGRYERAVRAYWTSPLFGAELAGLTAARDPHRAGCESLAVLEARNRVGGHTYNHDLGNGIISEGGGEWIGPGQTAIADLARELVVGTFDSFYADKTVYLAGDARVTQDVGEGGLASIPRL